MAHTQILLLGCFSNFSLYQFSIPDEPLYHLSQLKFDGEDGTSIIEHISIFFKFYESYEIIYEESACVLFFLTLEGHVNQWCHTLPPTSIHSLHQFVGDLHQAFDRYNYPYVCKRINLLTMKPKESIEDFSDRFLYLYCQISEEDMNQYFLKQEFECLVLISLHSEPKPPDFPTSPPLVSHGTPLISEEEPIIPFVPCPPPFPVPIRVPPCGDYEVGKSANLILNPPSHSSSIYHDSNSMEEILEWLMKTTGKNNFPILQHDVIIHNSSL